MRAVIDLRSHDTIKMILLRSQVAHADEDGQYRLMHYRAPNGRRFNVCHDAIGYSVCECVPNGLRRHRSPEDGAAAYWIDNGIREILDEDDPNAFHEGVQSLKIRDADVVRTYERVTRELMRRYPRRESLDDVVGAITQCIDENRWLREDRTHEAGPRIPSLHKDLPDPERRLYEYIQRLETQTRAAEPDPYRGLFNLTGPLPDKQKDAIRAYLKEPTLQNWRAICDRTVKATIPLWQAIGLVDPRAPAMDGSSGWCPLPDPKALEGYLKKIGETDALVMIGKMTGRSLDPSEEHEPEPLRPSF